MAVCRLGIFGRRSDGLRQPLDQIVELLRGAVRNAQRAAVAAGLQGHRQSEPHGKVTLEGDGVGVPWARGAGPDTLPLVADHRFGLPDIKSSGDHLTS